MQGNYKFEVQGTAADGQSWTVSGTRETANAGDFAFLPTEALKDVFLQLTQGRATYGNPGVNCKGPYSITKMVIEKV